MIPDLTNVPRSDRTEQAPTPNTSETILPEPHQSDEQVNELDKQSVAARGIRFIIPRQPAGGGFHNASQSNNPFFH